MTNSEYTIQGFSENYILEIQYNVVCFMSFTNNGSIKKNVQLDLETNRKWRSRNRQ